jgi:Carboxypeptidase regulatory-like domain
MVGEVFTSILGGEGALKRHTGVRFWILAGCIVQLSGSWGALYAQGSGGVRGRVTDPSGSVVRRATVRVEAQPKGPWRSTKTNSHGDYQIGGLQQGRYTVAVTAPGFAPSATEDVLITADHTLALDVRLTIATEAQKIEVQGQASHLEISPESNASAVVISGKSLDALSNDPDEFQNQLTALAGPSVGPNGGEIYIDGFTGGDLPPKSDIREIRVNANPFSVRNDRLGYGRIDIFTKPGNAVYHGNASVEYNNSSMNALSPFLNVSGAKPPPYHTWLFDGDFGGPLGKKMSFFINAQRRNINHANVVNTDVLDSNLDVQPYVASIPNPRVLTNVGPRVDFQLSPKNTLTVNYRYFEIGDQKDGVDTQVLPSQAYDAKRHHHDLQVIDTQVLSENVVNEARFQYLHFHNSETPHDFSPTINVLGAFLGGGDSNGAFERHETHYEFQDYVTMTRKAHLLQFGGFVRDIRRREVTDGNFNGTFTFNSLSDYQQTEQGLQNGLNMAQIQAAGYGPSQFDLTAGNLSAGVNRLDGALFMGDDWKLSPHFTLTYGLRFESENAISDRADWAPRVGIAWGFGQTSDTKTVLRAGWGIFYKRFDDDQMIIAERFNGQNQTTYIVNNPAFFPTPPPPSALSGISTSVPTVYRIGPNLRSPYDMDIAVSLERQLLRGTTVSFTYLNSRGVHRFLTNDVNAPLPGTFSPGSSSTGVRPGGSAAGNIYQYESQGIYKQTQLITNVRVRAGERVSLFGYYVFNNAHSDTAGVDSFAANPWNILEDYGRAHFDIRHRVLIGGSYALPFSFRLSSIVMANSGLPFSITLGQDIYGTGIHNARPSLATASTPPAQIVDTKYGAFNAAPGPGDLPIPPNTETGPANVMLNLRLSRTFGFGLEGGESRGGEATAEEAPHGRRERGLGGRGLGSGGGFSLGGATRHRYALTLSVSVLNALDNVNLAPPVAVIGSPLFGQSIALASGPFALQVGNPVANRLINVGATFSF